MDCLSSRAWAARRSRLRIEVVEPLDVDSPEQSLPNRVRLEPRAKQRIIYTAREPPIDAARRKPLVQRAVEQALGVESVVANRLVPRIANGCGGDPSLLELSQQSARPVAQASAATEQVVQRQTAIVDVALAYERTEGILDLGFGMTVTDEPPPELGSGQRFPAEPLQSQFRGTRILTRLRASHAGQLSRAPPRASVLLRDGLPRNNRQLFENSNGESGPCGS